MAIFSGKIPLRTRWAQKRGEEKIEKTSVKRSLRDAGLMTATSFSIVTMFHKNFTSNFNLAVMALLMAGTVTASMMGDRRVNLLRSRVKYTIGRTLHRAAKKDKALTQFL